MGYFENKADARSLEIGKLRRKSMQFFIIGVAFVCVGVFISFLDGYYEVHSGSSFAVSSMLIITVIPLMMLSLRIGIKADQLASQ